MIHRVPPGRGALRCRGKSYSGAAYLHAPAPVALSDPSTRPERLRRIFFFSRPGRSGHVRRLRGHRLLRDLHYLHPVAAVKQRDRLLDRLVAFCDLVSRVGLPATQGLSGTFGAFCSRYGGQVPFCPLAGHGHGLVPKQPAAGTRTAMPGCLPVTMPTIASREDIRRLLAYRYRVVRIQVA